MLELTELKAELDRNQISPLAYSLGEPLQDNSLCLIETSSSWEIFFFERGERDPIAASPLFADAAAEFLRLLLEDPTSRRNPL